MVADLQYMRLYHGQLELYIASNSVSNNLKTGYHLLIETEDSSRWEMEVLGKSVCGLSAKLILRPLDGKTPAEFIKMICISLRTVRPCVVLARLLSTNGVPLLPRTSEIEIRP